MLKYPKMTEKRSECEEIIVVCQKQCIVRVSAELAYGWLSHSWQLPVTSSKKCNVQDDSKPKVFYETHTQQL